MNVGERIRQLRTERNLTQQQLAEAIGIEQYSYLSPGVILPGEPSNIFSTYADFLRRRYWAHEITDVEQNKLEAEFNMKRIRMDFLLSDTYRGEEFEAPVDGGRRSYQLRKVANYERVENRYVTLLGLLLTFIGLFGFIVEARMRSVKIIRG